MFLSSLSYRTRPCLKNTTIKAEEVVLRINRLLSKHEEGLVYIYTNPYKSCVAVAAFSQFQLLEGDRTKRMVSESYPYWPVVCATAAPTSMNKLESNGGRLPMPTSDLCVPSHTNMYAHIYLKDTKVQQTRAADIAQCKAPSLISILKQTTTKGCSSTQEAETGGTL